MDVVGYAGTGHPGFVGQILYTPFKICCVWQKKTVLDPQEGDLHGMSFREWH